MSGLTQIKKARSNYPAWICIAGIGTTRYPSFAIIIAELFSKLKLEILSFRDRFDILSQKKASDVAEQGHTILMLLEIPVNE
jgi:hypothetical protein